MVAVHVQRVLMARIDLKKEGNVTKGPAKKADVTMNLSDGKLSGLLYRNAEPHRS